MGEICLSRELAGIIMDNHNTDPAACLQAMLHHAASATAGAFLASFEAASLPPPAVRTLPKPVTLCAWRIDGPGRVCLSTGNSARPLLLDQSFAPHTLPKVLLDERSKRPDPSRIHLLLPAEEQATPDAIRTSLLHHAQTALTPHRVRMAKTSATCLLDHTLEEAFAALIHPPARANHTEIALNQSPPWDKDHIDARCARHTLVFFVV